MKETFYFSHDYTARSDNKIQRLLIKHGMLGYGVFWSIIENLYHNANALPTDYECIAYELRCDVNIVKSIVNDFDLFIVLGDNFYSNSVQRRLNERNDKSEKARISAQKRWEGMRTHSERIENECEPNAIKESKVKESKYYSKNNLKNSLYVDGDKYQLYDGVVALRRFKIWVDMSTLKPLDQSYYKELKELN